MPLLEGLDGVNKMSKSLGNYIGINEPANDIFSKTMSIADDLMWRWFTLLSFEKSLEDIAGMKSAVAGGGNPRDFKVQLARELVDRFHGAGAGDLAIRHWNEVVRGGAVPADLPVQEIPVPAEGLRIGGPAAGRRAGGLGRRGRQEDRRARGSGRWRGHRGPRSVPVRRVRAPAAAGQARFCPGPSRSGVKNRFRGAVESV